MFLLSVLNEKTDMNYCVIIFVFALNALPMVFSTCSTSSGNYASYSVDEALSMNSHFLN